MIKAKHDGQYKQVGFIKVRQPDGTYKDVEKKYSKTSGGEYSLVFEKGFTRSKEGVLPLVIDGIGKPLKDYGIYGNIYQSDGVSPDTPQEIMGCGDFDETTDKYKLDVVTRGKNLFDKETMLTDIPVTTIVVYKALYVGSGEFTLSADMTFLDSATQATDIFLLAGNVTTGASTQDNGVYKGKSVTVTAVDGYITIGIRNRYTNIVDANIQLEAGSTATSYEPYTPPIISPIYLDSPLYKIGDYSDSRGMTEEVRVVKELVLTGEENWQRIDNWFRLLHTDMPYGQPPVLCSHFERKETWRLQNGESGIGTCGSYYGNQMYRGFVVRYDDLFTTAADFKSYLATQYAAGTPVIVYYVLAEPEVTSIEPVEIPTLNGTTVIDVDTEVKPSNVHIKYKSKT